MEATSSQIAGRAQRAAFAQYLEHRLQSLQQRQLEDYYYDRITLQAALRLLPDSELPLLATAISLAYRLRIPLATAAGRVGVGQELPEEQLLFLEKILQKAEQNSRRRIYLARRKMERSRSRIQRTTAHGSEYNTAECTRPHNNQSREPSGIQGQGI